MVQALPEDMIEDILSRPPTKSLCKFRCVCKSRYALICPHFIRLNNNCPKLFFPHDGYYSVIDCHEVATSDSDANVAVVKVECPLTKPFVQSKIETLTCCDSWVLLTLDPRYKRLLLLNPLTKQHKELGNNPVVPKFSTFGICYDRSNNDYKVVLVCGGYISKGYYVHGSFFTVFSFETNSWTRITSLPCWIGIIPALFNGVSVNGAPHWICFDESSRPLDLKMCMIVRFVLKDRFERVAEPPVQLFWNLWSLGALRGNLCAYSCKPSMLELWEMKQYGVKESWTQVCRIRSVSMSKPLAFTKKGELIVATDRDELIICSLEDNSLKTLGIFKEHVWCRMAALADSSVSFNCDYRRGNRGRTTSITKKGNLFRLVFHCFKG